MGHGFRRRVTPRRRSIVVIPLLLHGMAGCAATPSQPDIVSLEGPRSLDIDINGDGIGDVVFANFTGTGNAHSYFSYSINVRDKTDQDLLHSVHLYPDGYGPRAARLRILDGSLFPECSLRAHFLIRDEDDKSYELLTAVKLEHLFPPRPGAVEFTFHRLRRFENVGTATYIFDGYRKEISRQQYCDAGEAAKEQVLAVRSGVGSPPADDKERRVQSVE